jgi:hypothetical protein
LIGRVGLCEKCTYVRVVENKRGSIFHLCERSLEDSRYRKYPPLPVLDCPGFEAVVTEPEGEVAE